MNEEHTLSLEELGEIKTVKVYNQAYVDKQQKCIETLEKENAELKKEVEKHKWSNIFLEDCAGYDKKIAEEYTTSQERIAELETELTKRAEQIEALNKDKDYFSDALDKQIEATYKVVEELNEAKELLKDFVRWADWQSGGKCPSFKKIKDKAIDFLKEEEND